MWEKVPGGSAEAAEPLLKRGDMLIQVDSINVYCKTGLSHPFPMNANYT
jgi:hypothetical protein